MSTNGCCGSAPACPACAIEVSSTPIPAGEESSSQYCLFDDLCLTQNLVTDSEILPVGLANTASIAGVVINSSAAASISFTVLVSNDGETWSFVGAFNVFNIGYFSTNVFTLNAKHLKVRATTADPATVVVFSQIDFFSA